MYMYLGIPFLSRLGVQTATTEPRINKPIHHFLIGFLHSISQHLPSILQLHSHYACLHLPLQTVLVYMIFPSIIVLHPQSFHPTQLYLEAPTLVQTVQGTTSSDTSVVISIEENPDLVFYIFIRAPFFSFEHCCIFSVQRTMSTSSCCHNSSVVGPTNLEAENNRNELVFHRLANETRILYRFVMACNFHLFTPPLSTSSAHELGL